MTKPEDKTPREYWVVNDRLTNPDHRISKAYHDYPNLLFPVIHVIEKSAYDELKKELEREEKSCLALIDERDLREEQINQIADLLGDETEWSNHNDRGLNAIELARDFDVRWATQKAKIARLVMHMRKIYSVSLGFDFTATALSIVKRYSTEALADFEKES